MFFGRKLASALVGPTCCAPQHAAWRRPNPHGREQSRQNWLQRGQHLPNQPPAHSIMAAQLISDAEREYITQGVEQNIRNDGRGREDYRAVEVQLGVIAQASGSARLKLGNTDVIVGVKVSALAARIRVQGPQQARMPQAAACGRATHVARPAPRSALGCSQVEIGNPDPDLLDCGRLAFSVECSPVASSAFQVGWGG